MTFPFVTMASSQRLSTAQWQKLIRLYHGHADLWDVTSSMYRNQNLRRASYESIKANMESACGVILQIDEIKTKLASLRTRYGKELHRIQQAKLNNAGDDNSHLPKYEFFRELDFLRSFIIQRKHTTHLDQFSPDSRSQQDTSQSNNSDEEELFEDDDDGENDQTPDGGIALTRNSGGECDVESVTGIRNSPCGTEHEPRGHSEEEQSGRGTALQGGLEQRTRVVNGTGSNGRDKMVGGFVSGKKRKHSDQTDIVLKAISSYLQNKESRREEEILQLPEFLSDPLLVWARNIAQEISEIKSERTQQILKLQITKLLNDAKMEEIQNEVD